MQVRENDVQLLYGLFQSICSWALDKGYKDVSSMKNLLKLAMVDVCHQRHPDKPSIAAQMAIVTELGISLRNVQKTLKALNDLRDMASGFVKIRQIQREIAILLTQRPQTADEILPEVSYLMHAPYDLQKRTLRTILQDMEHKNVISSDIKGGLKYYETVQPHVNMFDPTDLSARIMAVVTHIDAFNHTVGQPYLKIYSASPAQAVGIQMASNEFLRGTGNAYENECRESKAITKPYYFYLGNAPTHSLHQSTNLAETILELLQTRLSDVDSPSLMRTHWYNLTPAAARTVFEEIRNFIEKETISVGRRVKQYDAIPFAIHFGLGDRQSSQSEEEI